MLRTLCNSDELAPSPEIARPVTVEAYVLRVQARSRALSFRHLAAPLCPGESPDDVAALLAGIQDRDGQVLVHSTSWRCEPNGRIVLAYAVAPDLQPEAVAMPLHDLEIARGERSTRPSPADIEHRHVAAHAARHLAFLLDTDPVVRAGLSADPELVRVLAGLPRAPAGQLVH